MDNQELQQFIGSDRLTVAEAMRRIDGNTYGILFLTDEGGHLKSCLTDGDIRRYLLSGGKMDGPAAEAANPRPRVAKSDEEAVSLYHRKSYVVIPIVDEDGRITGVYTGNGEPVREKAALNIPVVINAGGKGTRLEPFTRVLPKPLIPVGELPISEHIMKEYQSYGCNDFHMIVNYKRDMINGQRQPVQYHLGGRGNAAGDRRRADAAAGKDEGHLLLFQLRRAADGQL